jgi:hypothetical protein
MRRLAARLLALALGLGLAHGPAEAALRAGDDPVILRAADIRARLLDVDRRLGAEPEPGTRTAQWYNWPNWNNWNNWPNWANWPNWGNWGNF